MSQAQLPQPPHLTSAFKEVLDISFPYLLESVTASTGTGKVKGLRPVLLAISGGMDSMVLGKLLQEAGIPAIWVHCNFHLRGAESDRDEAFVRAQAALAGVELIVVSFDTINMAAEWKMSIEETARKLRYDFFERLIASEEAAWAPMDLPKNAPRFLMTAHHGGDQVETLLLNFFRGCGISGLHGIPRKNNYIIRPLLGFKRAVLLDYANALQIQWVEDSTNQSSDYTRNFLRNNILPELRAVYPGIEDSLTDNIKRFSQVEILYQMGLEKYRKRLMNFQQGQLQLSVLLLQKSQIATTLLWEALKNYGFGHRELPEIEKLLTAETGAFRDNPAKTYRVLRNRAHLILTTLNEQESPMIVIEADATQINFPEGALVLTSQTRMEGDLFKIQSDPAVAQLDSNGLHFPLLLRKWKEGDYFYPLGMRKKKKIARYLIDQKVGRHEKDHVWVLESQGRIIWVLGHRLDDRFKITQSTEKILKLKFKVNNKVKLPV